MGSRWSSAYPSAAIGRQATGEAPPDRLGQTGRRHWPCPCPRSVAVRARDLISWFLSALWTNRLGINMSIQRLSAVDFTALENPGIRSVQCVA